MKLGTKLLSLGLLLLSGVGFVVARNSGESKVQEAEAYTSVSTYYNSVSGTGSSLLSSINTKINQNLSRVSYDGLKTAYATTDVRSDGYIYDIYSDNTTYTPGSAFASSYSNVGDGYNREHTIPQSWWGGGTTLQGCDLYIVLPSDAKANGMRSNYPYGITTSGTSYKLSNDPSGNRLGTSTNTSYVSGTVFEPFESRKGDLARIYFYAVAMYLNGGCENGAVTNWTDGDGSKVFSNSGNNGFVQKYLNMLLAWHNADPVSQWEIDRNNNVENKQGNRNPFVDHPSWVDLIWGGTYTSSGLNYENTSNGTATVVNGQISGGTPSASISPSSASIQVNGTVDLTATLSNVSNANNITWTSSNTSKATVAKGTTSTTSSVATVTGVAEGSATIYCKHNGTTIASAAVTVTSSQPAKGTTDNPYTVSEAWGIIDGLSDGANNGQAVFVTGTVTGNVSYNENYGSSTFNITDGSKTINAYSISGASPTEIEGKTLVGEGYTVVVGGALIKYVKNNNTTYEVGFTNGINSSIYSSTPPAVSPKTLSSISLNTNSVQTNFTVGDTFNYTNLIVTANYSDSTTSAVAPTSVSSPDMSSAGTKTITVSYTEDEITKTATYEITVSAAAVEPTGVHTFKKITSTSELKTGTYMIVYETGSVAFDGDLDTLDAVSNTQSISIVSNKFDLNVDYSFTITVGANSCTIVSSSGYSIGRTADTNGFNSSNNQTYTNTISFTNNGDVNIIGSGGAYLRYNKATNQTRFRYYTSSTYTNQQAIQLYRMEDEEYAETFVDAVICNSNGTSAPTYSGSSSWSTLQNTYNGLTDTSKSYFTSATYSTSGSGNQTIVTPGDGVSQLIANCVSKYDLIVSKYHYTNFMSRSNLSSNSVASLIPNADSNTTSIIVIVVSLLSITALGGFLFIKHRKEV